MGHIFADIQLTNPRKPDLKAMSVRALADTGALMLCLPEHIAIQLELETETLRAVTVADGRAMKVPSVVPSRWPLATASAGLADRRAPGGGDPGGDAQLSSGGGRARLCRGRGVMPQPTA